MMNKSVIQNFQIPVLDFQRAKEFYDTLMGYELDVMEYQGFKLGIFQFERDGGVGGTIISGGEGKPSKDGTLIYLHCGSDLNANLERIKDSEGNIHKEKTELGPGMGYFAIVDDTEGNRVGLYSTN